MIPWRQPVENDDSGLISASSWTAASHWAALNQETVWLFASTFIHLLACVVGQIRTSARNHILKPHLSANISRVLNITILTRDLDDFGLTPPHKLPRLSDTWEIWNSKIIHTKSTHTKTMTLWVLHSISGFLMFVGATMCYSHPFYSTQKTEVWAQWYPVRGDLTIDTNDWKGTKNKKHGSKGKSRLKVLSHRDTKNQACLCPLSLIAPGNCDEQHGSSRTTWIVQGYSIYMIVCMAVARQIDCCLHRISNFETLLTQSLYWNGRVYALRFITSNPAVLRKSSSFWSVKNILAQTGSPKARSSHGWQFHQKASPNLMKHQ